MANEVQNETQIRMTIWTAVVVFLFAGAVTFSLLQPPKTIHITDKKSNSNAGQASSGAELGSRGPAAATFEPQNATAPVDALNDHQAVDLDLPCGDAAKDQRSLFNHNVVQVRLMSSCGKDAERSHHSESKNIKREIASTDIRNQANGFSATVFAEGEQDFSTDYISLSVGENHIHIAQLFKNGEHQDRDLIVVRQKE